MHVHPWNLKPGRMFSPAGNYNLRDSVISCEKLMDSWFSPVPRLRSCIPRPPGDTKVSEGGWERVFFFGGKMGEGNSFCGFVLFNYVMFGYHSLQVPDEMTPVPKMIFVMIVHHWCSPLSNCEGGYVLTLSPMALRASFPSLRTTGLYTVFRYGYATLAKKSVALVLKIHDLKQYCPLRKQESWFGMPFSIIYQLIFHWWLLFDSFINIINQL